MSEACLVTHQHLAGAECVPVAATCRLVVCTNSPSTITYALNGPPSSVRPEQVMRLKMVAVTYI